MDVFVQLIDKIKSEIINPLMVLLFVLGLLMFFWGFVEYFYYLDNPKSQEAGKLHMIWGSVGMFIMLSVFGIMQFLCNLLGC